jgi:hypothetical protein
MSILKESNIPKTPAGRLAMISEIIEDMKAKTLLEIKILDFRPLVIKRYSDRQIQKQLVKFLESL